MNIKSFVYKLTPPYFRHVHRARKVYDSIAKDLTEIERTCCLALERNRAKIKRGERIKVAFLHMYATEIQDLNLYDQMLSSPYFDPYFVVIPVFYCGRDQQHLVYNYNRTLRELTDKYGSSRVLSGYNVQTQECIDYTDRFDLASTNTPYDDLTEDCFKSRYWASKGIPVFYIPYFYMGLCRVTKENLQMVDFNFFWKVFVPNHFTKSLAKEYMANKGKNLMVTGYPKLDKISSVVNPPGRKLVIIAPHHLIGDSVLDRGGFREYAKFLQNLPSKYPQVDFIFRPHPQLFVTLKKYWSEDEIDRWLSQFLMNENVTFSIEGDYLQLLATSDALIHDCGSFVAEYLYFNKPCAYIFREGVDYQAMQLKLGLRCMDVYFPIKEEKDWFQFIEEVVLGGKDVRKDRREAFAKKHIMVNHPHATQAIYDTIVEEVTGRNECRY